MADAPQPKEEEGGIKRYHRGAIEPPLTEHTASSKEIELLTGIAQTCADNKGR